MLSVFSKLGTRVKILGKLKLEFDEIHDFPCYLSVSISNKIVSLRITVIFLRDLVLSTQLTTIKLMCIQG